jgi:hypothetical protein
MAASEDQPQPVVLDAFLVPGGLCAGGIDQRVGVFQLLEPRTPAHPVDGLEAPGRNQPCPRIGGHAIARPLLQRRTEGIVQRLFGEIEVAEEANQGGEDAARVGAVEAAHRRPHPLGGVLTHRQGARRRPLAS